ncbi:WD40-repeat-containing domain protein [Crucibulum laeve]|uniref:WD40-repeat-containing domain protein n=1 Tax=Crucibulum laeve TaxID=68775 RepID=A0A5C3LPA6_9AGAR|nr:WD40-repeat-containing domain protein [Crucibulum laeve]
MEQNSSYSYESSETYSTSGSEKPIKPSQNLLKVLEGHIDDISSVAYSPDGQFIASGCRDNTIGIWSSETGLEAMEPLKGHNDSVWSVMFSPSGKCILSGSGDNSICIWDTNTGQMIGEPFEGHTAIVWSAAYSPDGRNIVSGSGDKTIRIWDVETGKTIVGPLEGHSEPVRSVSYSPNGRYIVSASWDSTVRIWDAITGVQVLEPLVHPYAVEHAVYSPNGKYIASACGDVNIYLWDSETGTQIIESMKGHSYAATCVSFSPNGELLASCSHDRTIRVWNIESGKESVQFGTEAIQTLEGHTEDVNSIAFSPDGKYIVSGSDDKTVRIWEASILDDNESWFLQTDASKVPELDEAKLSEDNESTISNSEISDYQPGRHEEDMFSYKLSGGNIYEELRIVSSTRTGEEQHQERYIITAESSEATNSVEHYINETSHTHKEQQHFAGISESSSPAHQRYAPISHRLPQSLPRSSSAGPSVSPLCGLYHSREPVRFQDAIGDEHCEGEFDSGEEQREQGGDLVWCYEYLLEMYAFVRSEDRGKMEEDKEKSRTCRFVYGDETEQDTLTEKLGKGN